MVTKFTVERLVQRNPELAVDCPNCGSARLILEPGNGLGMDGVNCPKCGMTVILDALSVTVVRTVQSQP